jgi:hypothetical protein
MALRLTGLVLGPNLDGQALGVTASVMHGFLSQQRVLETDLLALGVEVFSDRTVRVYCCLNGPDECVVELASCC